jgi:hypothetical protein
MRKSDFREDREFSYDPPDDDAPMEAKMFFQRKLREFIESPNCGPHNYPWVSTSMEYKWWLDAYGLPPQYYQQQQERYLKRQRNGG